jgi:hypothetical protein
LNLGTEPVLNKDTISTCASRALSELAALKEKSRTKIPSADTMSALDDVLSVVKATKTYKRSGDANSGFYCTIPIKYEFQDKETSIFAETVLKDKCKVQCATLYPLILWETIKQVINGVKAEYPDYYARVTVDTSKI